MVQDIAQLQQPGALPVIEGGWLLPSGNHPSEPRWGHPDGMQLGLAPLWGPRGLLRIFTPYLGHARHRLVNFIAVEPIPAGTTERGYSELEPSSLDPEPGKRFWSMDDPADPRPRTETEPARGVIDTVDGVERLTVFVGVERFDNGADVYVRVRFRADRPHEVAVAGYARETSVDLDALVLSATMGNWARLRELHLADRVVTTDGIWPGFAGRTASGFTEHAAFSLAELSRDGAAAVVSATPNETDLTSVTYSDDTRAHWHYEGERGVQGWRVDDPHPDLRVQVNARWAYWASKSPIPGGPSFENFEIVEPFRQGAELRFSVEPLD